jgi:hypothetical protein
VIRKGDPIDWLDIRDGLLAVSCTDGKMTLIDPESRVLWAHEGQDGRWTVRVDGRRVYHADDNNLIAYDRPTGKRRWRKKTGGAVLFGWQTERAMYVGTMSGKVLKFNKSDGRRLAEYRCGAAVPSCATSPDGKYVFGATGEGAVVCHEGKGKRLWKFLTGCGAALSMQYHKERLYIVTNGGYLAAINLSQEAIQAAEAGQVERAKLIRAPKTGGTAASRDVETTSDAGHGVVLQCVKDGSDLRMHVVSEGYNHDWWVQFPRDIRELGARYVVDEVREATQGGFYRALGHIKKLAPARKKRR